MAKSKSDESLSPKDYERIGRDIEFLYQSGHRNHWRLFKLGVVRGIGTGVGSAIGATLIIGLVLWLLSLLDSVPFIGEIVEKARMTIEEGTI